jgi:hypothetical protein
MRRGLASLEMDKPEDAMQGALTLICLDFW